MFEKKYSVSNKELRLTWFYRSKYKAVKLARHLIKGEKDQPWLGIDDQWLVRNIKTGEIVQL